MNLLRKLKLFLNACRFLTTAGTSKGKMVSFLKKKYFYIMLIMSMVSLESFANSLVLYARCITPDQQYMIEISGTPFEKDNEPYLITNLMGRVYGRLDRYKKNNLLSEFKVNGSITGRPFWDTTQVYENSEKNKGISFLLVGGRKRAGIIPEISATTDVVGGSPQTMISFSDLKKNITFTYGIRKFMCDTFDLKTSDIDFKSGYTLEDFI